MALDRGDALRAVELLDRQLRQLPEHRRLDRVSVLELLVHSRVARGELEQAGSALEALRDIEQQVRTAPLKASADLAEGVLVAAGGEHDGARVLFEDALDGFEGSGAPFEAARARIELATSLLALGRADAAEREAAAALSSLVALGATDMAERAKRLVVARESSSLAEVTAREREVLLLVVEGLTNRQIAERLVVSEHTVHRHVTNILRKLDLPSRTAAAAHAVRAGLLEHRDA
jgi:LuxR family maltose regulon positive regulatory protein